jgi:hypothetical protein
VLERGNMAVPLKAHLGLPIRRIPVVPQNQKRYVMRD